MFCIILHNKSLESVTFIEKAAIFSLKLLNSEYYTSQSVSKLDAYKYILKKCHLLKKYLDDYGNYKV